MDITVAIVAYNAAPFIKQCLESVLRQDPHGGMLEILVVDGCSNDGTQGIVKSFGDHVHLIENPGRTIASNRNVALREARHPYIAFTDADCVVPVNWLPALCIGFEQMRATDRSVAGAGGGNTALMDQGAFHVALGVALNSFLGSLGSVQGKIYDHVKEVPSLACLNVLYDRVSLQEIGGFDEELRNMCEDADINYRLRKAGRTLYFVPNLNVEHHARQNFRNWCSNMYFYGIGRSKIMRKHKTLFSPVFLLPLLFLPVIFGSLLLGFLWRWSWLSLLYFPAMIAAGFLLAFRKGRFCGLRAGIILCATHLCYALGLWRGLFHRRSE